MEPDSLFDERASIAQDGIGRRRIRRHLSQRHGSHQGAQNTVDYSLEWRKVADQVARGAPLELDEDAPTFADALKEQLGIKMLSQKGPSELFVVDHIEKPAEDEHRTLIRLVPGFPPSVGLLEVVFGSRVRSAD